MLPGRVIRRGFDFGECTGVGFSMRFGLSPSLTGSIISVRSQSYLGGSE